MEGPLEAAQLRRLRALGGGTPLPPAQARLAPGLLPPPRSTLTRVLPRPWTRPRSCFCVQGQSGRAGPARSLPLWLTRAVSQKGDEVTSQLTGPGLSQGTGHPPHHHLSQAQPLSLQRTELTKSPGDRHHPVPCRQGGLEGGRPLVSLTLVCTHHDSDTAAASVSRGLLGHQEDALHHAGQQRRRDKSTSQHESAAATSGAWGAGPAGRLPPCS